MLRSRLSKSLLVAASIVVLSAAPAYAKRTQAVTDCTAHNQLTHTYTLGELRGALATMPPAIREYTNCFDVIQRQLLAQLGQTKPGGGGSGSGSGGSFLPVPVIIILGVLVLATAGFTVMAVRRRDSADDDGPPEPPSG